MSFTRLCGIRFDFVVDWTGVACGGRCFGAAERKWRVVGVRAEAAQDVSVSQRVHQLRGADTKSVGVGGVVCGGRCVDGLEEVRQGI